MSGLIQQPAPVQPKITVKDGVLCLYANLQRADYGTFQRACDELCRSNLKNVTLDLTRCTYGTSSFVGDIVEAVTQMKTDGKNVCVNVSPELGRLLQMAHLYHLFTYNIVDPHLSSK
jgi:anti-anti-sigma regulatory factor